MSPPQGYSKNKTNTAQSPQTNENTKLIQFKVNLAFDNTTNRCNSPSVVLPCGSGRDQPLPVKESFGPGEVHVQQSHFKLSDVESHFPFKASEGGEVNTSEYESSSSLSFSSSNEDLLFEWKNHRQMLDLSTSLPHVISNDRKSSNFLTSMNVFCLIQGVSTLALPFVTVHCFVAVIFLTIFLAFVNWYTAYLLVECQHQISQSRPGVRKRIFPTYISIGKAAFPTHGELIMKIVTFTIVVSGIAYFILLGQLSFDICQTTFPLTTQHWIIIWAIFVLPTLYIDRVSVMAWFSTISTVSLTLVVLIISGVLVSSYRHWKVGSINWGFNVQYFFLAYGIAQNSFFVHLVVPAIEGSMVKPENCHQVIGVSFGINTGFKVIFQSMAALTFGAQTRQSVTSNITSPLSIALVVNILTAINLYCAFPIILRVFFEMIDMHVLPAFKIFDKNNKNSFFVWKTMSRLLTVVFIVFVSVSIPEFGLVVSFLGNLRSTVAAMVLPLCFYIKLRWRVANTINKMAVVGLLTVAIFMGLGAGYFSIRTIISSFHTG